MATRTQRVKVGAFLIACIAVMASALSLIAGLSDPGTTYTVVFNESILGLYEGGMVEYLGVPVGKVKEITVNSSNKPVITLAIDRKKVTLYKGVEAQPVIYSLAAGSMAVSLEGGHFDEGELPPGSVIPAKPSLITDVTERMTKVLDDVTKITAALSSGLDGLEKGKLTEMIKKVDAILDDAKKIAENANKTVEEANTTISGMRDRANKLIDNVNVLSEDARPLVKDADELIKTVNEKLNEFDVKTAGENLNKTLEHVAELTKKFNEVLDQFNDIAANTLHEGDNLEHSVRAALEDMRKALTAMQMFVDQLAQDPAQLVRGKGKLKGSGQ